MNLCLHVISKKTKTHPNKSKRSRVLIVHFWYFLVFLVEKLSPQESEKLSPQESEKLSPQESEKLSPHADPPSMNIPGLLTWWCPTGLNDWNQGLPELVQEADVHRGREGSWSGPLGLKLETNLADVLKDGLPAFHGHG